MWLPSLISVFLLIILFSLRKIANYDLGFHLAGGRWIIENMTFPVKDMFTYTVSANEYLDIQWLYQVVMFSVQSFIGDHGLTIFNAAAITVVFILMLKRNNVNDVYIPVSLIMILVTLICIQVRFSYRPEIFTWIFMLLMLIVLDRNFLYKDKIKKGMIYFLPVIMLFWVNMHGLFIIGFVIMISYIISGFVRDKKFDKDLLIWTGISFAVVFINPYFSEGVLFPFYLFTRLQKGNIFQMNILELQSPWGMTDILQTELYIYYSVSAIAFLLLFVTVNHRKFHEFALMSAFFYLSFSSFRNIPLFMIYAFFIVSISISDLIRGKNIFSKGNSVTKFSKVLSIIIFIVSILTGLRVITDAYYIPYGSEIKFGTGVDILALPDKASDYINQNTPDGKIFNNLESGGWLEWKTGRKVYIDGRLEVIREDFYKEYLSTINNAALNSELNKYTPELIVNSILNFNWSNQLSNIKDYSLTYWDGISAVYKLQEPADSLSSFNFKTGLINVGIDTVNFSETEKDRLLRTVRIKDLRNWLSGFYSFRKNPYYLIPMGNFAFESGQFQTAEFLYLNYIKEGEGFINENLFKDIFLNLGSYYYNTNDLARAQYCLERYLDENPGEREIVNKLNEIKKNRKN
ncbi:MAG: hypothetical protein WAT71_12560 [Ignavibacteria bacterium]